MADEPTTLRGIVDGIVEGIVEDVGDFTYALNFVLFDADSDQLITLAWLLGIFVFFLVLIYYFVKTLVFCIEYKIERQQCSSSEGVVHV